MNAYRNYTDQELAGLLGSGGETVFREIYERYWDKLYILARKRMDDPLEAEEIVQDIFCNLWRKRESLLVSKGLNNYFSVAVKYEVINRLAKQARATAYHKETANSLSESDISTLQQLDYQELLKQLEVSVSALPEKCRIVFKMQQEEGFSQQQIADKLGIAEKTVEAHLSRARKTLRGTFGNLLGLLLF